MANYKGIDVHSNLRPYVPHMPIVEAYRESLQSLQAVWDTLNLLGQLSGTTSEVANTRAAFSGLTNDLLNSLAEQTLQKTIQQMASTSQVVIDILVRNLFERTADIGFLATDEELKKYISAPSSTSIGQRLTEYVKKYSVYDDVILLGAEGEVLTRLNGALPDLPCAEDWVIHAQQTSAPYVEYYGPSELFPDESEVLLYAYRVSQGRFASPGVLALSFRIHDELDRIFSQLQDESSHVVLGLLDSAGQVIAASDPWQLPKGAKLKVEQGKMQLIRFSGQAYLAYASQTRGYQGYQGPGWQGLVLMPLTLAFDQQDEESQLALSQEMRAAILANPKIFSTLLQGIPKKAEAIQRNLSRSIWNGTIRQTESSNAVNPAFSKILLSEISRNGQKMREVFTSSIGNLQHTVISSLMRDCQFQASLAIDIMDRNLYERANDCRWWALDPAIGHALEKETSQQKQRASLTSVLQYINQLYTVYENLLVFDVTGKVLAVSKPAVDELVGQHLDETWVNAALSLNGSQTYCVSDFVETPLYQGRSTYIYASSITDSVTKQVIGGIGIVFDSEPQFASMLSDILPRDEHGQVLDGAFACYVDANSKIISSTDWRYQAGEIFPVDVSMYTENVPSSHILTIDDVMYSMGVSLSTGYREYKGDQDPYRNTVYAFCCVRLGTAPNQHSHPTNLLPATTQTTSVRASIKQGLDVASFYLGTHWLGLPAVDIIEAIELQDATRLPNTPKHIYGALVYQDKTLPLFNLHAALGISQADDFEETAQVVIIKDGVGKYFGILVDALGDVPTVSLEDVTDVTNIYVGASSVLASIVKMENQQGMMLTMLSVESIAQQLAGAMLSSENEIANDCKKDVLLS
ncbi:chemotaxis protein CheW [Leeia sp. TBRC 13508]|uniref:Chemotaxis protein CheW n=1 Tax=Leeia speluncae TaxID=2884804 RepID=A0ABS8D1M8_9NEIS|nr:chemotaxis protein CheW [Leeia speluncae]MCB6182100.1 chemotaxis protein CheW [Leeia speluncae]